MDSIAILTVLERWAMLFPTYVPTLLKCFQIQPFFVYSIWRVESSVNLQLFYTFAYQLKSQLKPYHCVLDLITMYIVKHHYPNINLGIHVSSIRIGFQYQIWQLLNKTLRFYSGLHNLSLFGFDPCISWRTLFL